MARKISIQVVADTKQATTAIKKVGKDTKSTSKKVKKSVKEMSGAFSVFAGNVAANVVTGAFKKFASVGASAFSTVISKAAEIETITAQLSTLTGSVQGATKLIGELQEFSSSTPFQLPGIAQASKQLLAFGFSQDEVIPKLQFIGDIAAATGNGLNDLAGIFGQVSSAGKLTGERFAQLSDRAVPIQSAIAKTLGVAESRVKDLVSSGAISAEIFEKAMKSMADKGGLAFQGMQKRSEGFDGVMSTLSDNISTFAANVGKDMLPVLVEFGNAFIKLIQENKELAFAIGTGVVNAFLKMLQVGAFVFEALDGHIATARLVFNDFLSLFGKGSDEASLAIINGLEKRKEALNKFNEFVGELEAKNEETRLARIAQNEIDRENELRRLEGSLNDKQAVKKKADKVETEAQKKQFAALNKLSKDKAKKDKEIDKGVTEFKKMNLLDQTKTVKTTSDLLVQFASESGKKNNANVKRLAKAQAVINGFLAIQQAYASGPPPFNLINVALIAGLTKQNIDKINNAPSFQDGGIVPGSPPVGGRDNTIANVSSGELILSIAQQETIASRVGGGATINISGNVIADDDSQVQNLIERIRDEIEFGNAEILPTT